MRRFTLMYSLSLTMCAVFHLTALTDGLPKRISPRNAVKSVSQVPQGLPFNFQTAPSKEAAKIPLLFYQYLNDRQYNQAVSLMIPRTRKAYLGPSLMRYMRNIKHADVEQFHDITQVWGGIPLDMTEYYKVKVYIAVVNFSVIDPKIAGIQIGRKVRRFFVVKTNESAPWQLMAEQTMSPLFVSSSWNLNLSAVS